MFGNVRTSNTGIAIPGNFKPPPGLAEIGWAGGGVLDQLVGLVANVADEIPPWSYWPNFRDIYLKKFWKSEPILAGAIYSLHARIATLGFQFNGTRKYMKKYYQELAGHCDNEQGLSNVFGKTVLSLLTQDNGAFWYLHGAGRPDQKLRGRVVDVRFLDASQCWRSLDPDYPVIYHNPLTGSFHRIHKTRIVMMANMPQTDELGRNIGFCAVSRVLEAARIMRDIRRYKQEKVGGMPTRGLLLVQGLNPKQLKQTVAGNDQEAEQLGYMRFKGIDTIASINKELKAELIDLASLPDGFNEKDDIELYVNIVAVCTGVDSREFWPATSAGATKADAEKSHLKTQGKGIGDLLRVNSRAMNWHVIGDGTGIQFDFDFKDTDEEKAQADIASTKTTTYSTAVNSGALLPEEMRALMIADNILDASVLANLAAAQTYDEESPVTDENLPEDNGEVDMTVADQTADENPSPEEGTQAPDMAQKSVTEVLDYATRSIHKPKRKHRAKSANFGVSLPLDPITGKDVEWAIAQLGKML